LGPNRALKHTCRRQHRASRTATCTLQRAGAALGDERPRSGPGRPRSDTRSRRQSHRASLVLPARPPPGAAPTEVAGAARRRGAGQPEHHHHHPPHTPREAPPRRARPSPPPPVRCEASPCGILRGRGVEGGGGVGAAALGMGNRPCRPGRTTRGSGYKNGRIPRRAPQVPGSPEQ
jgi:hypothetical protein